MKPAARITDLHACPMVTGIVPHVGGPILPPGQATTLIGGLPAARVGDLAVCVGPPDTIAVGAPTTMIGGMPAARMGDQMAHGGVIVLGCPTVLIGDGGSGSGGGARTAAGKSSPGSKSPHVVTRVAPTLQSMAMQAAKRAQRPFCEECAKLERTRRAAARRTRQVTAFSRAKAEQLPLVEPCPDDAAAGGRDAG